MKVPSHPIPSGDRKMARLFLSALREIGHDVFIASSFRSWDQGYSFDHTQRLASLGQRLAGRLIRRFQRTHPPDLWFTYHVYHKAPDWLGPIICDTFRLPYIIAEASFAPKQAQGPWHLGHQQVALAIRRADAVLSMTVHDAACLRPLLATEDRLVVLSPFLDPQDTLQTFRVLSDNRPDDRQWCARTFHLPTEEPWLLAVGMMRPGDKSRSYQVLAQALSGLVNRRWLLLVVGDGCARSQIVEAFRSLPPTRVRWLGALDPNMLRRIYSVVDFMVWPAINEAYGMALLEAQAAGKAVVAGHSAGVAEIIQDRVTGLLSPCGDEATLASHVVQLLDDPELCVRLGQNGARKVMTEHSFEKACQRINHTLNVIMKRHLAVRSSSINM